MPHSSAVAGMLVGRFLNFGTDLGYSVPGQNEDQRSFVGIHWRIGSTFHLSLD